MKKIIRIMLAAMLFVTFATSALAESAVGFTPEDVLQWLEENDQYAEDATGQAMNASHRLAEMLVYVDGLNANEDDLETLQSILDTLTELRNNQEISTTQSLTTGCVQVVRALIVLANEADRNGVYGDTLQGIIDSYNETDNAVETAEAQTVNALFTAMKLAPSLRRRAAPPRTRSTRSTKALLNLTQKTMPLRTSTARWPSAPSGCARCWAPLRS